MLLLFYIFLDLQSMYGRPANQMRSTNQMRISVDYLFAAFSMFGKFILSWATNYTSVSNKLHQLWFPLSVPILMKAFWSGTCLSMRVTICTTCRVKRFCGKKHLLIFCSLWFCIIQMIRRIGIQSVFFLVLSVLYNVNLQNPAVKYIFSYGYQESGESSCLKLGHALNCFVTLSAPRVQVWDKIPDATLHVTHVVIAWNVVAYTYISAKIECFLLPHKWRALPIHRISFHNIVVTRHIIRRNNDTTH